MITRRVLLGGALTVICAPGHCSAHAGCRVEGKEAEELVRQIPVIHSFSRLPELISSSGNRLLDQAFTYALYTLARDFEVQPGFGYFDDHKYGGRPNAKATSVSHPQLNRSDGTVLFGVNLLHELLDRPSHPDAAIVAVAAHEFAHIAQFKRRIPEKLGGDTKKVEHHADFMAGWFSGVRKLKNPNYQAVVFAAILAERAGDSESHGTGRERAAAAQEGFLAAARDKLPLDRAIEAGLAHVGGGFNDAPTVPYTSYR